MSALKPPLSRHCCKGCGKGLDIHQAARGRICSDPACRRKESMVAAAHRVQESAAALRGAAVEFRAQVSAQLDYSDPTALTLAIVPAFNQPVVKLQAARRKAFRDHLTQVVQEAYTSSMNEEDVAALTAELTHTVKAQPVFPHAGTACTTCRGHCCREGGTHAYITPPVIRSYIARNPGRLSREVVHAFLGLVPASGFQDSCVYHGPQGCGLPPTQRSATCNQYHCPGLKELRATLASTGPRPVLVVASNDAHICRSTLARLDGTTAEVCALDTGTAPTAGLTS